ncbi:MAG: 1-(5-phosphoribosyl)-5-((5-phosphoribosylamino)methylideneamino)imidazole-4-carboxamide isomerase, partial [Spirochaetia bacterium]|nr:1-(5-phosphoribosyl)-5-((5-phosphoribosylamino)methylideneamino)imidazole-4-carboxamide isomerase [Spirochaetia bacterium]
MKHEFRVIPAIDLLDGQVVRLLQGQYDQSTIYGRDPAELVRSFIKTGVDLIHVVDLNAARTGDRSVNVAAVSSILAAAQGQARIEIGGGIRNMEAVEHYLTAGVDRCIVGTAAVTTPDFVKEAVKVC